MGKRLAIRGHSTRGNEVIEILEMMGGKNRWSASGRLPNLYYFISNKFIIYSSQIEKDVVIFTLEEFLDKNPFKVGDKVFLYDNITEGCVTGMKWDEETVKYCVYTSAECWCDVKELLKWNALDLVERHYGEQCEEMLKDITLKHLYERGMEENIKTEIVTRMDIEDASFILNHMILPNKVNDELEYKFPDGYEFDKVENGKIILKPIKPKYPTTYVECKEMMGENAYYGFSALMTLQNLIICRDAYWKIAGEQMGLDKPWEPDWMDTTNIKYAIIYYHNNVKKVYYHIENCILAFPTVEMRDAFYENFKDLIEQCKELL